jgi:hypothetical protein
MNFQKYKMDIIALSSTIVFNCVLNITVGLINQDVLPYIGWFVSPIIGGAARSIIATKKHQIVIIPAMIVLDIFVFIPLVLVITGWWLDEGYLEAMFLGTIAAVVMTVASLVTLAIRFAVEAGLKEIRRAEEKQPQEAAYQETVDASIKPLDIISCPSCHSVITSNERFCTYCGKKLEK